MIDKVIEEIYSYAFFGEKIYLENMEKIARELGNPHEKMRTIHIAGTNGKGSTSTMIEKGLIESGYKVGKYTSPHIIKFNERICLNGVQISDDDVIKYYYIIKDVVTKLGIIPSYFEIVTSMMYKYFYDKGLDFLVLETGLGGRLDATNISSGEFCVITNISLDHMEQLGDNLDLISIEKLGIVKENSKVFIGRKSKELETNLKNKKYNKLKFVQDEYKDSDFTLDYTNFITKIRIGKNVYDFSLFGKHQYENFLTAYAVLKEIGVEDDKIKVACEKVVWPGRFEVIKNKKIIILDGAHNEDGIKKMAETISKRYNPDDVTVITSILKDKDRKKMLETLENISNNIILTSISGNKRGGDGESLIEFFKNKKNIQVENDLNEAVKKGLATEGEVLLICGSLYLISQVKERFNNE